MFLLPLCMLIPLASGINCEKWMWGGMKFLQGEEEAFISAVTKQKIRHTQRLCPIRDPKSFYDAVTAHLHIRNVFKENNQRSFLPRWQTIDPFFPHNYLTCGSYQKCTNFKCFKLSSESLMNSKLWSSMHFFQEWWKDESNLICQRSLIFNSICGSRFCFSGRSCGIKREGATWLAFTFSAAKERDFFL